MFGYRDKLTNFYLHIFCFSGAPSASNNELDISMGEKSPKSPTNSFQMNNSSSVGAGGLNAENDEERFNGDGVMFQGKLIGTEYVAEARGEQMCQASLKKLKVSLYFGILLLHFPRI